MSEPKHSRAVFIATTDEKGKEIPLARRKKIEVHFNPETLDITFTNSVQKGKKKQPAQVVNETTAKLSMELIFDTTLIGKDVREETHRIAKMMDPAQHTPRRKKKEGIKIPAIIMFQWGTILFEGYIDSYKERIEFFSSNGVPLRAIVTLSMTENERSFAPSANNNSKNNSNQKNDLTPDNNAPIKRLAENENMTQKAQKFGDPNAAKDMARKNGIENLRHPEVDVIVVAENLGRNASSLALSATASITSGKTGAQFANLQTQGAASSNLTPRISLSANVDIDLGQSLNVNGNMGFGLGGEVDADINSGLSADVGLNADIELGIQFED